MNKYQLVIFLLTLFIASPLLAHAGHDHHSPMSNLVHFLWLAPVISVFAILHAKRVQRYQHIKASAKNKRK